MVVDPKEKKSLQSLAVSPGMPIKKMCGEPQRELTDSLLLLLRTRCIAKTVRGRFSGTSGDAGAVDLLYPFHAGDYLWRDLAGSNPRQ